MIFSKEQNNLQDLVQSDPINGKKQLMSDKFQPVVGRKIKKKWRRNRNMRQSQSRFAVGLWTMEEQKLYLDFIKMHSDVIQDKKARRSEKVYKNMANIIKTRSAEQCQSHHQKMFLTNKTISNILKLLPLVENCLKSKEEKQKKREFLSKQEQKPMVAPYSIFIQGNHIRIQINTKTMLRYSIQ